MPRSATKARFAVMQMGYVDGKRYLTREAAQREADRLNREADEELGHEVMSDGCATVVEDTLEGWA